MQLAGIGRVMFWEGGSLWLALITGGNGLHLHHAVQISLPLSGTVRYSRSQSTDWVEYPGAVIAPDTPHAFQAPGRVVANILFEPECPAGRALLARYHGLVGELAQVEDHPLDPVREARLGRLHLDRAGGDQHVGADGERRPQGDQRKGERGHALAPDRGVGSAGMILAAGGAP